MRRSVCRILLPGQSACRYHTGSFTRADCLYINRGGVRNDMYIRMLSPHGGISLCQCYYSIAVSFYITETLVADVSVFYIFKKLFLRFAGIRVYILAQCDSMIFFALQFNLQIKSALKLVFPDMISGLMNLISFLIFVRIYGSKSIPLSIVPEADAGIANETLYPDRYVPLCRITGKKEDDCLGKK